MKPSRQNEMVFSKNVAIFEENYWRLDEQSAVKFLKPGRLLIGGVGAGRTIGYLLNRGFEIVAVDISPEMVKKCKERWPHVDVFVMDLQKNVFVIHAIRNYFHLVQAMFRGLEIRVL